MSWLSVRLFRWFVLNCEALFQSTFVLSHIVECFLCYQAIKNTFETSNFDLQIPVNDIPTVWHQMIPQTDPTPTPQTIWSQKYFKIAFCMCQVMHYNLSTLRFLIPSLSIINISYQINPYNVKLLKWNNLPSIFGTIHYHF